jgi:hypothetical protein
MPVLPSRLPYTSTDLKADTLRENMNALAAAQRSQNLKIVASYNMHDITTSTTDGGVFSKNAGTVFPIEFRDTNPNWWDAGVPPDYPFNVGMELIQSDNCTIKIPETSTYLYMFNPQSAHSLNYSTEDGGGTSTYVCDLPLQLIINGNVVQTTHTTSTPTSYYSGTTASAIYPFLDFFSCSANDLVKFQFYRDVTVQYDMKFKGAFTSKPAVWRDNVVWHNFILWRVL